MIAAANRRDVRDNRLERQLSGGGTGWTTTFFGMPADGPVEGNDGPQAYLVEQAPGSCVLPHFHDEDQFQVIVSGGGTLNRRPVRSPAIHYANRHTAYGPIIAGPEGLSYFTLRASGAMGAHFLPGAIKLVDRNVPRRQAKAEISPHRQMRIIEELLAESDDSLAAWSIRAPARSDIRLPAGSGHGGRFLVILEGQAVLSGEILDPLGVAYVSDDANVSLLKVSGAGPAHILLLQMPRVASVAS